MSILEINNAKIQRISNYVFGLKSCVNIQILNLNLRNLIVLKKDDFKEFHNVINLTIIAHNLQKIEPGALNALRKLNFLRLELNSLEAIPTKLFFNLSYLLTLILITPNIRNLSKKLLKFNTQLQTVEIDHVIELSIEFVCHLKNLRKFDCRRSFNASFINIDVKDLTVNLRILRLNKIIVTNCNFCQYLRRLTNLTISDSIFMQDNIGSLLENNNLRIVNLTSNINIKQLQRPLTCKTKITFLNLSNNFITNIFNYNFSQHPHVTILNLSQNDISVIKKNTFVGLSSVRMINLSRNNIFDVDLSSFTSLSHLQVIDLGHNSIRYFKYSFLAQQTSLRCIYLNNNLFHTLQLMLDTSIVYSNLELLDFQNNQIDNIGLYFFIPVKRLRFLYLGTNLIKTLDPDHFKNLRFLEYLDLSYNFIRQLDSKVFFSLLQLKTLKLRANSITYLPPDLFQKTPNLRTLDLSANHLFELPCTLFQNNRKLAHLLLNANLLERLPDDIFYLLALTYVDLSQNTFIEFSSCILTGNNDSNCTYILDSYVQRLLSESKYFYKPKIIFVDF